jgi:tetratricopeptide (TPR) repeat protein
LSSERFSQVRLLVVGACALAMLAGTGLVVLGLAGYGSVAGIWMAAGGGMLLFLGVVVVAVVPLLLKMESTLLRQLTAARDLHEALTRHAAILEAIAENTRISDAAKSLARRDEELEALRNAIREDIRNERWEAALNLIDEMERRFGYKEESDRSREELDEARNERIQAKLAEAIQMIEGHFAAHEWPRAQHEIDRLLHALPDDPRVLNLLDRMRTLKEEHKQELRIAWDDAVRRSDTDRAIDILKELDQYMSPAEAQVLQSTARHVFKEKLLQLGVQFRFAVNERRWQDALSIGLELIRDFPNARMASEVREVLDTLRERARAANEPQPAAGAVIR